MAHDNTEPTGLRPSLTHSQSDIATYFTMSNYCPPLSMADNFDLIERWADFPPHIGPIRLWIHLLPQPPFDYLGDPSLGAEYYYCSMKDCDYIWAAQWTRRPSKQPSSYSDLDTYKKHAIEKTCWVCARNEQEKVMEEMRHRTVERVKARLNDAWEEIDPDDAEEPTARTESWDKIGRGEADEEWQLV